MGGCLERELEFVTDQHIRIEILLRCIEEVSLSFLFHAEVPTNRDALLCLRLLGLFIILLFDLDQWRKDLLVVLAINVS
jgi:hypothetical protein